MANDTQKEKEKKSSKDILARIFFIFARFSWFFGIIITLIVFFVLYRFIIQPQYQKIVQRQEEIKQLNLEGEERLLSEHVKKLHAFITLSETISEEEKNHLNTLLQDAPDTLVLQIQLEKFLAEYGSSIPEINLGDVVYEEEENEASTTERQPRQSIIDLSSFFEEPSLEQQPVSNENDSLPKVVLGTIPIDIDMTFDDYFAAKDFIRDIENLVPLIDIQTIVLNVTESEGDPADDNQTEATSEGETSLSLSGVIHVAKQE